MRKEISENSVTVLINKRARRGAKLQRLIEKILPDAQLVATASIDECRAWIRTLKATRPRLVISGGGDGTTTALVNEFKREGVELPPLCLLPLGTGNAWAHVSGAPKPKEALRRIAAMGHQAPPLRTFRLVEVMGSVAPFAGTGFDADLVRDYREQLETYPKGPLRDANEGLRGYLGAVFTRTLPKHVLGRGVPTVRVINTGGPAETIDEHGRVVPLPGGNRGAVLYEGPAGVAGAATIPEWGYHFRAFPFAESKPGRLSARVYGGTAVQATRNMFKLWRGQHPMPLMHDFIVDKVRMEFDRDVPLQFAGDLEGTHRVLEFELSPLTVRVVDWRLLSAARA